MGKRKGGYRRKTRALMRKDVRTRGKISLTDYFASYKPGDKVALRAEPAVQGGIYHLRFHGKAGTILGKQGTCYQVAIVDGGKPKTVIVHPVHLQRPGAVHAARPAQTAKAASAVPQASAALKPVTAAKTAAIANLKKV